VEPHTYIIKHIAVTKLVNNNTVLVIAFLIVGTLLTTTAITTMVPAAYADNKQKAEDDSAAAIADCDDNEVNISPGAYEITEAPNDISDPDAIEVEGDCTQDPANEQRATGEIQGGETRTCTFINSYEDDS
jgi:hypothetical protein